MSLEKVIIIGSGPAGLTAAIYASRAMLKPLMFEGEEPGGQLMLTTDVENYPGFPEGITGPKLMDITRKQAERFGTRFITQNIKKVDFSKRPFTIWTNDKEYQAESIIISTGASAKWLGLDSEKALMGRGVSACATCDGAFFKDVEVAVIGGGDTAMEEAQFLTRFASKVYVIHRRDTLRASKIMAEKVKKNPKVEFIWNSVVDDILGDTAVTGIRLKNTLDGEITEKKLEGVFVAIGHKPNTDIFKDQLKLSSTGYIETEKGTTYTSVEGVFASGDVQDHVYRQAVTAAGTGCMAAIDAERWLESQV